MFSCGRNEITGKNEFRNNYKSIVITELLVDKIEIKYRGIEVNVNNIQHFENNIWITNVETTKPFEHDYILSDSYYRHWLLKPFWR